MVGTSDCETSESAADPPHRPSSRGVLGPAATANKRLSRLFDTPPVAAFAQFHREWNEDFQLAFEQSRRTKDAYARRLELCQRLAHLEATFVRAAETIGQTIVKELKLDDAHKTILPMRKLGVAGGDKYIAAGLFFKLLRDSHALYGADEYAMKAASAELRGFRCLHHAYAAHAVEEGAEHVDEADEDTSSPLHRRRSLFSLPLVALVDYRGYRLLVLPVLPIGSDTLYYGSNDGGRTFYAKNASMGRLMEAVGSRLNLKGNHLPRGVPMRKGSPQVVVQSSAASRRQGEDSPIEGVLHGNGHHGEDGEMQPSSMIESERVTVYGPMDIEVHMGKDDRVYILDAARLMPPSYPSPTIRGVLIPADGRSPIRELSDGLRVSSFASDATNVLMQLHPRRKKRMIVCDYIQLAGTHMIHSKQKARKNHRASYFASAVVMGDAVVAQGGTKNIHLYNHLRPEAVQAFEHALSSDAYSSFSTRRKEDDEAVTRATEKVLENAIPDLARKMDERSDVTFVNSMQLKEILHDHGINIRFLGQLRACVQTTHIKTFLMSEMITRVLKNTLRRIMRSVPASDPMEYKRTVLDFFNLALGSSRESEKFWTTVKVMLLLKHSSKSFSAEELNQDDWRLYIDSKLMLLVLLQSATGVQWDTRVMRRFQSDQTLFEQKTPFLWPEMADLVTIRVHSKTLSYHRPMLQRLIQHVMHDASHGDGDDASPPHKSPQEDDGGEEEEEEDAKGEEDNILLSPRTRSRNVRSRYVRHKAMQLRILSLLEAVCGKVSNEALVMHLQLADTLSIDGDHKDAQERVEKARALILEMGECLVERLVAYYHTKGKVHVRAGESEAAHASFLSSLHILEGVYGDARGNGIGMGHPFALILLSELYHLAESQGQFALAFRYAKQWEAVDLVFPFPDDPRQLQGLLGVREAYLFTLQRSSSAAKPSVGSRSARVAAASAWLAHTALLDPLGVPSSLCVPVGEEDRAEWAGGGSSDGLIGRMATRSGSNTPHQNSPHVHTSQLKQHTHADPLESVSLGKSFFPMMSAELPNICHSPSSLDHQPARKPSYGMESASTKQDPIRSPSRQFNGGEVWIWGRGKNDKYLRLADPISEDLNKPNPLLPLRDVCKNIIKVAAAVTHCVFLSKDGRVWNLSLSRPDSSLSLVAPPKPIRGGTSSHRSKVLLQSVPVEKRLEEGDQVVDIVCRDSRTIAISAQGVALTWGAALTHSLGVKKVDVPLNLPARISGGGLGRRRVIRAACGETHSLLVTDGGALFSFGSNSSGALGHGTYKGDVRLPTRVRAVMDEVVVDAGAGDEFSIVVSDRGAVYSFGRGDRGQLGHKVRSLKNYVQWTPRILDKLAKRRVAIAAVSCGIDHVLATSTRGHLWVWGSNINGKCGLPTKRIKHLFTPFAEHSIVPVPKRLRLGEDHHHSTTTSSSSGVRVVEASAAYSHSVVATEDQKVWAFGSPGAWGQLGHGQHKRSPTELVRINLVGLRVVQLSAAYGTTLAVTAPRQVRPALKRSNSGADVLEPLSLQQEMIETGVPRFFKGYALFAAQSALTEQHRHRAPRTNTPPPPGVGGASPHHHHTRQHQRRGDKRGGHLHNAGAARHRRENSLSRWAQIAQRVEASSNTVAADHRRHHHHKQRHRIGDGAAGEGHVEQEKGKTKGDGHRGGIRSRRRLRTASHRHNRLHADAAAMENSDSDAEKEENEEEEEDGASSSQPSLVMATTHSTTRVAAKKHSESVGRKSKTRKQWRRTGRKRHQGSLGRSQGKMIASKTDDSMRRCETPLRTEAPRRSSVQSSMRSKITNPWDSAEIPRLHLDKKT